MRKIVALSVSLLFLVMTNVFAQPGTGGRTIDERLARLTKALNLDADQQTEVRQILENRDKNVKKAFEANSGDRRAMQAAMRDLTDQANYQIMNILRDEQKAKFKEYLKEQKKRQEDRQNRPNKRGGGRRF
ncbi:Spy/CpxP family protein refolding chaperone [Calditrichota bacterium GD2]